MLSLCIVPVLLAGPALSPGAMLLHAHGLEDQHAHLTPAAIVAACLDEAPDWHAAQHGEPEMGLCDDSAHGQVPPGTTVALKAAPLHRSTSSAAALDDALKQAFKMPVFSACDAVALVPDTATPSAAAHRLRDRDSGAVRVLRSRGALLI